MNRFLLLLLVVWVLAAVAIAMRLHAGPVVGAAAVDAMVPQEFLLPAMFAT